SPLHGGGGGRVGAAGLAGGGGRGVGGGGGGHGRGCGGGGEPARAHRAAGRGGQRRGAAGGPGRPAGGGGPVWRRGVGRGVEEGEERCAGLARRGQFLQASGVEAWPDGTVAGRYTFRHALYPQVVYARLPAARCRGLHRRIGARLEAGYADRGGERAVELA